MLRLASTVMVARQAGATLEVLMLRRSSQSAFMPDAFVFPGGTVDDADRAAGIPVGWTHERLLAEFRDEAPDDAHAIVRAAARELAEEASIVIDASSLHLFSHWITPVGEPRRYDTYFFVAAAPPGQAGRADAVETHDARWVTPAGALDAAQRGTMRIIYPTLKHLERLAAFGSVDALLAYARSKPIVTIMPEPLSDEQFAMQGAHEGRW